MFLSFFKLPGQRSLSLCHNTQTTEGQSCPNLCLFLVIKNKTSAPGHSRATSHPSRSDLKARQMNHHHAFMCYMYVPTVHTYDAKSKFSREQEQSPEPPLFTGVKLEPCFEHKFSSCSDLFRARSSWTWLSSGKFRAWTFPLNHWDFLQPNADRNRWCNQIHN